MTGALDVSGRTRRIGGALLAGGCAMVGLCLPAAASGRNPEVKARLVVPARLAAGATGTVLVEVALGPGWHVNTHSPKLRFLVPTSLTLVATGAAMSDVRYPAGVLRRFEFSDVPLEVYEGTIRFEAALTLPARGPGAVNVDGVLAFQACDSHQCFRREKAALPGRVIVAAGAGGDRAAVGGARRGGAGGAPGGLR